jgi:hypothetical protein
MSPSQALTARRGFGLVHMQVKVFEVAAALHERRKPNSA